jgi:hypothetical protein
MPRRLLNQTSRFRLFQNPFFSIEGVSGNLTLKIDNMNEKDHYTVGELLILSPRLGKSLALGEVIKIEKVNNLTNIVIQPAEVIDWVRGFIQELSTQNQEIYVTAFKKPSLAIEVAIGREVEPVKPRATDPTRFSLALDNNGDGKVTDVEAKKFVNNAVEWSQGAGLPFGNLAEGIPRDLPVTRVSVNLPPQEMTNFNGLAVRLVYDRSSRPMLYIPFKFADLTGAVIDLDTTILIRYSDFMDELQNELTVPGLSVGKEPGWRSNRYILTVTDKVARNRIVNGEEIASIKKVKKCNKYYYKIELVETGLVPSINAGSYQNCLFTCENFAVRPPPFTC